ncbi:SOS-response transcriptional repressor LexA [Paraburkholderia youngii]
MIDCTIIAPMKTVKEIRRENARALATEGPAEFARRIESTTQQVNQTIGPNPTRNIGDQIARRVEAAYGLPTGWLDVEHILPADQAPMNEPNTVLIERSANTAAANLDLGSKLTSPQRLKAAIIPLQVTSETLASVTGVGAEVASQWLEGAGPEISLVQAVKLQNTYGINAVWLTKGKGDPGVAVRFSDEFRPIPIKDSDWKPIPVVGMAQLGDNGHWADLEYPVGHGDGYIDFPSRDPNAYALKCVGDSMRPRIRDGEFVIIEPNHPIEPGDDVLVKSKDGRVMVKTFLYKRAGRCHLISINEAHPPVAFADDEIEKMHYVAATARPSMWRPGNH